MRPTGRGRFDIDREYCQHSSGGPNSNPRLLEATRGKYELRDVTLGPTIKVFDRIQPLQRGGA